MWLLDSLYILYDMQRWVNFRDNKASNKSSDSAGVPAFSFESWLLILKSYHKIRGALINPDNTIPDPKITRTGQLYCIQQREDDEAKLKHIKHIYCSPLRRCIETALLLFSSLIEQGQKLELRAELQSFSVDLPSLGAGIHELEQTYGDVATIDLPHGYNIKYIKKDAKWNQTEERKCTLEQLFKETMKVYRGQHVEIVLVTHSGVISDVFDLSKIIVDAYMIPANRI